MGSDKFKPSALWMQILETHVVGATDFEFPDFRNNAKSSSLNTRFTAWSIDENAHRFFKTLLFNEAKRLNDRQLHFIDAIRIRDLGNPVAVHAHGREVCIDYLQAALEVDFMSRELAGVDTVLEIGAGFGRTCHAVLENFSSVNRYCIVDLRPCLEISRRYLESVLDPEQFAKIQFAGIENLESEIDGEYGLAINIDSMAEMDESTVDSYLELVSERCRKFFVKNPLGKYSPTSIGLDAKPSETATKALETGKLRKIIDIFDAADLESSVADFLAAYRPATTWELTKHAPALPWSYYHQALFRKAD